MPSFLKAPFGRIGAIASLVALDGKLYLAGGFSKDATSHFAPARSIEVFDPATQTWSTTLESSPMPPGELHMLPIQGRLLLAAMTDGPRELRFALVAP
ncbi:kelch repeat-containing protein [Singulisphaera rosea]